MNHSLIVEVIIWTVLAALVVFLLYFGTVLYIVGKAMRTEANDKVNLSIDGAISHIDDELLGVEEAAHSTVEFIKKEEELFNDEDVYTALETLLQPNSFIQGVAIAYAPSKKHPNGFAPCVSRFNDDMVKHDVNSIYNYLESEWYKKAIEQNRGMWSKAFREINGTTVITYSHPIYNKREELLGVIAYDVNVEQDIHDQLSLLRPYSNALLFVLDSDMTFLIHPDTTFVTAEGYQDILAKDNVYNDIKNRVRSRITYERAGHEMLLYCAPIHYADLTMAVELPAADITAPLESIRFNILVYSIIGIILLVIVCRMVLRRKLKPINDFANVARSIAKGNFNTVVPNLTRHNELWLLGRALDNMQHSLNKYLDDLTTMLQKENKLEHELLIASKIQQSMLPKKRPPFPQRDDIHVYGRLTQAKEVGGDLYDYFIHNNKLYFCIGDVSGKGIPASLIMSVTKSIIHIISQREDEPHNIVKTVNDAMTEINDDNMFVTLFIGILDLSTGILKYCNAGHDSPVLITNNKDAKLVNIDVNLPLGVMENVDYHTHEATLSPDDALFLYTDGLTEAENSNYELFGEGRLLSSINEVKHLKTYQIVEYMLKKVQAHANGHIQSDDLAMLCLRYKGKQEKLVFEKELLLTNKSKDLSHIEELFEEMGTALAAAPSVISSINLAVEEAVVNVINYAYPKGTIGHIRLCTSATEKEIKIVVMDSGTPFDPTQHQMPDITLDVEERQVGGLGILMVKEIMDALSYDYVGEHNVLTMRKKLQ